MLIFQHVLSIWHPCAKWTEGEGDEREDPSYAPKIFLWFLILNFVSIYRQF